MRISTLLRQVAGLGAYSRKSSPDIQLELCARNACAIFSVIMHGLLCSYLLCMCACKNKTPAKAFTPPAETKMGTRPGRAVTRAFIGGGVYSLISVLPNQFLFKSIIIRVPSKAFYQ